MHIASPETGHISSSAIVASNIPVAVGAAWANKMQKNGKIVVVFFGDGAMDEGNFWESINMASLWSLPILFICENNKLAVHTRPEERQGYSNIEKIIEQFGMIKSSALGISVELVYDITDLILKAMIEQKRPGFIELEYYRHLEHVGINSDINETYREVDNKRFCKDKDPILELRERLLILDINVESIEAEISKEIYVALEHAKKGEFSDISEIYKDVFYG